MGYTWLVSEVLVPLEAHPVIDMTINRHSNVVRVLHMCAWFEGQDYGAPIVVRASLR